MTAKDGHGKELSNGDAVQVIEVECGQGRDTIVLKTCFLKKA